MNDLISRQAVIEAIVNTVSEIGLHDNSEAVRYGATFRQHEIIDIIEGMPSAQPERKAGKWIKHISDIYPADSTMECNVCHAEQTLLCDDNYCPNCGAKMEVEE